MTLEWHTWCKDKTKQLVNKSEISNLVKNSDFNTKLATSATKVESKAEQDKIVKLEAFDSSYLMVRIFFAMMVSKICLFINQHLMC